MNTWIEKDGRIVPAKIYGYVDWDLTGSIAVWARGKGTRWQQVWSGYIDPSLVPTVAARLKAAFTEIDFGPAKELEANFRQWCELRFAQLMAGNSHLPPPFIALDIK